MSPPDPTPTPKLFYRNLNSVRVSVYASIDGVFGWANGWRIDGDVYGPHCRLSDTLPARIKLQDLGPGNSPLSSAIVPDPCPWSAELPATYKVTTNVRQKDELIQSDVQQIAFKTLTTKANKLELTDLNGFTKRWVLRAAAGTVNSALSDGGDECRELRLSRIIIAPGTNDCSRATEEGLWIIAVCDPTESGVQQQLDSLSQWPCVACCILPAGTDLRNIERPDNLLLGTYLTNNQEVPEWAEIIIADAVNPVEFNSRWDSSVIPVIAHQLTSYNNDRNAREQCAALQASLAPQTNYAGYVISKQPLY